MEYVIMVVLYKQLWKLFVWTKERNKLVTVSVKVEDNYNQ